MAHLNLYVPDDLEMQIKEKAKENGKSLSAYVSELIHKDVGRSTDWHALLDSTWGKWQGDFPELEDSPVVLAQLDSFDEKSK